ncbi:MAG: hypothetical protein KAJ07_09695 [Planctomycetes bacterium]|nr:hypothetical protein [Planctomycetota bacterium]
MVALARRFAPQPQLVLNPAPLYVAGVIDTVGLSATLVFDQDLVESVFDPTKLFLLFGGSSYKFVAGTKPDGNVIQGDVLFVSFGPPLTEVVYSGFPTELVGVTGVPVDNFTEPLQGDVPVPVSAEYSVGNSWIDIQMSEAVFINTATKSNFFAIVEPNILNIQSVSIVGGDIVRLGISIDGPGVGPDRVGYDGQVDGIENAGGDDVPLFEIAIDTVA